MLREHIAENMPVDFPAAESGIEIELLKQLFSPEEAGIALEISSVPEPAPKIYGRLKNKIPYEKFLGILDSLAERGAIMGPSYYRNLGLGTRYGKAPFIVGMYEFQAGRLTEKFERDTRKYINEKYRDTVLAGKVQQMRTIPIEKSAGTENRAATYDNARELIMSSGGKIVALPCVCREGADLLGEPCRATELRETCLLLNENAAMYSEFKRGREISKDEALEIIGRAEKAGLVLQPSNSQRPGFICCCCGCCCGMLVNLKKLPSPAQYFRSNYYAKTNPDTCSGCGKCLKKCQMEAISIKDKTAVIDTGQCIGCGVCVGACPEGAMSLINKEKKYIPPKNIFSMYRLLLLQRYGAVKMFKMMIKTLMGKKL